MIRQYHDSIVVELTTALIGWLTLATLAILILYYNDFFGGGKIVIYFDVTRNPKYLSSVPNQVCRLCLGFASGIQWNVEFPFTLPIIWSAINICHLSWSFVLYIEHRMKKHITSNKYLRRVRAFDFSVIFYLPCLGTQHRFPSGDCQWRQLQFPSACPNELPGSFSSFLQFHWRASERKHLWALQKSLWWGWIVVQAVFWGEQWDGCDVLGKPMQSI